MDSGRSLEEVAKIDALPVTVRAQAARDRNRLASLVARGVAKLRPDGYSAKHPEFVEDIERRARAQRPPAPTRVGMDTIRPNAKKAAKRKRRR